MAEYAADWQMQGSSAVCFLKCITLAADRMQCLGLAQVSPRGDHEDELAQSTVSPSVASDAASDSKDAGNLDRSLWPDLDANNNVQVSHPHIIRRVVACSALDCCIDPDAVKLGTMCMQASAAYSVDITLQGFASLS